LFYILAADLARQEFNDANRKLQDTESEMK